MSRWDEVTSHFEHRVTFSETDGLGFVHHRCAAVWFEQAREGFFRRFGAPAAELYRKGWYLALRQAITPDRLLGRMTATMRFLTVAAAPLGSLAGGALATAIGLRATLLTIGVLALALVAAAVLWSPVRGHRKMPVVAGD